LSFVKSNYSRKGEPIHLRRDECGALLPLDEIDLETVGKVTSGTASREAKAQARKAEREGAREAREREDAPRREAKATERETATRVRDAADDEAARRLLTDDPAATVRDLVARVRGERACGTERAHAAVSRVKGSR